MSHSIATDRLLAPLGAVAIPLLVGLTLIVLTWPMDVAVCQLEIEVAHLDEPLAELEGENLEADAENEHIDDCAVETEISSVAALEFPKVEVELNLITPESALSVPASPLTMPALNSVGKGIFMSEATTSAGKLRTLQGKDEARKRFGGNAATEEAVLRGLRWLKARQLADGRWVAKGEGDATAFALLALLAHGEGFSSKEFGNSVRMAIEYLIRHHKNNMAVYALAEAAAIVRTPVLSEIAEGAVAELCSRQKEKIRANAGNVVARYCATMAMKSARIANLRVAELDRVWNAFANGYVEMRDAKSGDWSAIVGLGTWHYMIAGVCLQYLGRGNEDNSAAMVNRLEEIWELPTLGKTAVACCPVRSNYFATTMFFNEGGERWRRWNEGMVEAYVKGQRIGRGEYRDENGVERETGWWVCEDEHIGEQPFWPTAYVLMQLMTYYRYLPTKKI